MSSLFFLRRLPPYTLLLSTRSSTGMEIESFPTTHSNNHMRLARVTRSVSINMKYVWVILHLPYLVCWEAEDSYGYSLSPLLWPFQRDVWTCIQQKGEWSLPYYSQERPYASGTGYNNHERKSEVYLRHASPSLEIYTFLISIIVSGGYIKMSCDKYFLLVIGAHLQKSYKLSPNY